MPDDRSACRLSLRLPLSTGSPCPLVHRINPADPENLGSTGTLGSLPTTKSLAPREPYKLAFAKSATTKKLPNQPKYLKTHTHTQNPRLPPNVMKPRPFSSLLGSHEAPVSAPWSAWWGRPSRRWTAHPRCGPCGTCWGTPPASPCCAGGCPGWPWACSGLLQTPVHTARESESLGTGTEYCEHSCYKHLRTQQGKVSLGTGTEYCEHSCYKHLCTQQAESESRDRDLSAVSFHATNTCAHSKWKVSLGTGTWLLWAFILQTPVHTASGKWVSGQALSAVSSHATNTCAHSKRKASLGTGTWLLWAFMLQTPVHTASGKWVLGQAPECCELSCYKHLRTQQAEMSLKTCTECCEHSCYKHRFCILKKTCTPENQEINWFCKNHHTF